MQRLVMFLFMSAALIGCGAKSTAPQLLGVGKYTAAMTASQRAQYYTVVCGQQGHVSPSPEFSACVYELSSQYQLGQLRSQFYDKALN